MQEPNFPEFFMPQEEPVNIKEFLIRGLHHWKWFVISIFICLSVAWLINHYSAPVYKVDATILVEEDKKGNDFASLFKDWYTESDNIQNHIGILRSYSINYETLKNLGWDISWFRETPFYDKDIYGSKPPYVVKPIAGKLNKTGIPIEIIPLSDGDCELRVEAKVTNPDGELKEIHLQEKVKFGKPFENEIFAFIIEKDSLVNEKEPSSHLFYFNDIEQLALEYKGKLSVKLVDKQADLISLQLEGPNPVREMDYLNELGRVYIQYGLKEKNRMSENTLHFLDSQLSGITDSLYRSEDNFTTFRSDKKVIDLTQEAGLVLKKMEELESDKAMAEMRLSYIKNLKKDMKDSRQMKEMVTPSVVGFTDATFNSLVTKLIELYSKREVLTYSLEDRAPNVQILDKELQMTLNALSHNVDNILSNLELEVTNLNDRIHQVGIQLTALPQNEQKLINLKRRFDLNNELYNFLLQKRAETAITMASNVPDVKILDPARKITTVQTGPKKMLNYLIGLIMGFFIPIFMLFVYDFLNDSIQTKEEVEKRTKLPITGIIAHNNYNKDMIVVEHPRSSIAESFRSLRTNLKYLLPNEGQKVIAVHSTIPGEGKSFVSINLASAIALNNKKVLLVGVDMRKPRLHQFFDVNKEKGLSNFLINRSKFDDIVQETNVRNLNVVLSGPIPPNPAELLENGAFEKFLNEAKVKFDFIILDNAPVSMVTDALLAGAHADVNLFLLRFKQSHRDQIKFIDDLGEKKTMPNISIVLNDAKMDSYGYTGKYSSYNYGYGHGYYDDSPNLSNFRKWAHKGKIYIKRRFS
jgi:tyrosine-protein kinase Etk/Wzc